MTVRTGQVGEPLAREDFVRRFAERFADPAFDPERAAIDRLAEIAWDGHQHNRKAPFTSRAGPGFANPDYELSDAWRTTRDRLRAAEMRQKDAATPSRVLLVCGSPRNDGSCPGEMSKTFRLVELAQQTLADAGVQTDLLDLSRIASEAGRQIHPCKGCVATAMPLCHWPCSCYPNHALGQVNDWMAEIYERWVAAHGVLIATPVHWYQAPSVLKLMIDRLVCADGGNPDPSSTHGKRAEEAKALELKGWSYPKHLAGRAYGLVVHGDVAGVEGVRRALSDWLDWMGLIDAGAGARLDRYIGYYRPYATSHDELDRDTDVQQEVRNVASALARAVADLRAGRLHAPDTGLPRPRPK
ncbi:MAG TPA: flavodoxin family protein [Burkholderiaceae bacterium]|nr:flavodoxin family protein [Burkholderiaceae bacterium]